MTSAARNRLFLAALYTFLLALGASASIAASYSPELRAREAARVARYAETHEVRGS